LVLSDQKFLFLTIWESLGVFWQTAMCLLLRCCFSLATLP
jgi:hypothetical protein